jgi:transcriptional regulator GlxA family with amidase domain
MKAPQTDRYRRIVEHFEQVACAKIETLMRVADLCRVAEVNQRTLSRAFREVRGIGPHHYLRSLRLREVKRVLASERITVTQAAMRFGFREVGRFAALYKKTFGVSPSETKRCRQAAHVRLRPLSRRIVF